MLIEWPALSAHSLRDPSEIAAIEENDGGRDKIEGCGSARLIFMATVPKAPEAMESNGAGKRVSCFALVEFCGDELPEIGILKPPQGEEGALDAPDFAQGGGQTVLLPVGGQLLEDEGRRDHLVGECPDHLADFVGVSAESG